jgi:hypothetical protein
LSARVKSLAATKQEFEKLKPDLVSSRLTIHRADASAYVAPEARDKFPTHINSRSCNGIAESLQGMKSGLLHVDIFLKISF